MQKKYSDNIPEQIRKLEKRLAELENFRLIAGNRIRIAQTGNNTWLVEAEEPDLLTDELRAWIMDTDEKLKQLNGIGRENGKQNTAGSSPEPEPDYSTPYRVRDYPFRVKLDGPAREPGEETGVILCGPGFVYAGTDDPLEVPEQKFSFSSAACIYLELRAVSSGDSEDEFTLALEVKTGVSCPKPENGLYVVPVAEIEYSSTGRAVIRQQQFGHVFVAGGSFEEGGGETVCRP